MVYKLDASAFSFNDQVLRLKNKTGMAGFLLIYADWCGYCKKFKPDYIKLDYQLNEKKFSFPLFAIDDKAINSARKLGPALNFKGFPTIKVVNKDGSLADYKGERSATAMAEYIKSL